MIVTKLSVGGSFFTENKKSTRRPSSALALLGDNQTKTTKAAKALEAKTTKATEKFQAATLV